MTYRAALPMLSRDPWSSQRYYRGLSYAQTDINARRLLSPDTCRGQRQREVDGFARFEIRLHESK